MANEMSVNISTRRIKGREVLVLECPKKIKAVELNPLVIGMLKRLDTDDAAAFAEKTSVPYIGLIHSEHGNPAGEITAMISFETMIDTIWLTRQMIRTAIEFFQGAEVMKQYRQFKSN